MRGKGHLIWTTVFFVVLWVIFNLWFGKDYFTITQVIAAIPLSFFPDIDKNFGFLGHRSWFTHSIILWEIVYIFNPHFIFLIIILAIGFHCLCDIRIKRRKRTGFYTIKWFGILRPNGHWKYKGMGGRNSTIWLMCNFILVFIQFIIIILLF